MEFDNNTIILIIIVFVGYYLFFRSKEQLTNDDKKGPISEAIKANFKDTVSFSDYTQALSASGNMYLNLTSLQTFNTLQELYKKNTLTLGAIQKLMY
jgi:hypothetical protein